jgi:hypothetical protein
MMPPGYRFKVKTRAFLESCRRQQQLVPPCHHHHASMMVNPWGNKDNVKSLIEAIPKGPPLCL